MAKGNLHVLLKGGKNNRTILDLGPFQSVQLTPNGDLKVDGRVLVYYFVRLETAPRGCSWAYDRGHKDRLWAREIEVVSR